MESLIVKLYSPLTMQWFYFSLIASGFTLCWIGAPPVTSQILNLEPNPTCNSTTCESSSLRCEPEQPVPSCNSSAGCYCLNYQCDNRRNTCTSKVCANSERAECVLNKYGTSCMCIPLATSPYCNTGNTACNLRGVGQADIRYFGEICQELGQEYYAETCRVNGQCRCASTSTYCNLLGCGSSPLRCGPNQTVPSCDLATGKCICPKFQCDNLLKNCSSTNCGPQGKPECVLDRYGTSCKCMPLLELNDFLGDIQPIQCCIVPGLNQVDIEHFDNICEQLGGSYFADGCGTGQCRCLKRRGGCRTSSDCPCPQGFEDYCIPDLQRCERNCQCRSDEACSQGCRAGLVSACNGETCTPCFINCTSVSDCANMTCPTDKPDKTCTPYSSIFIGINPTRVGCSCNAARECNTRWDCPDCNGDAQKACRTGGTCTCLSKHGCFRNGDCDKDNGYGCSQLGLNPSCCWVGCGGRDSFCRCRGGSGLTCSGGDSGTEQLDHCGGQG
ncbi:multiple epidermal growth factor-like domains protein 10 [Folsomia candida]|uniref:multiple epidermal growth factor-like domains protein 10 n=1 Tax=Folsomia candida TaxID=158441 RepID=UPI000B90472F|nr:multiple epidermal growth factor-like domains protein 10 [Folsomia candida]